LFINYILALVPTTTTPPQSNLGDRVAVAQLRNKVPIGYKGMPQIHPQNDHHPILYIRPSTDPTHHPNRIQIQSVILPQYTFRTDRRTNRQIV